LLSCFGGIFNRFAWAFLPEGQGTQAIMGLVLGVALIVLVIRFFSQSSYRSKQGRRRENLETILHDLDVISWSYEIASGRCFISPGTEKLCGYNAEELMNQPELWQKLVHPYDMPRIREAENDLQSGKKVMLENRILLADGSSRWIQNLASPLRDSSGKLYRLEGIIINVTEQKELEERMKHLAFYDALTGLPNRSMFENYFANFITRGRFSEQKMAVVFIDLDAFKGVNDELGHDAGDIVLKEAAVRMKSLLRGCDLLSRLGGDEFVALLTRITSESPELVGQRIVESFWEPFEINERSVNIGVSVGISIYPDDGENLETLIKHADEAMYMAKRKGKNTSCIYNPSSLPRS